MIRIGLIGAGKAGRLHAAAFAAVPDGRLVAVSDVDPARGAALARDTGARFVPDPRQLLAAEPEAVIIAVPHASLTPIALEAIRRGKHVLVEKPMSITLEEADDLVEATQTAGVVLQVGYVHRYRPEVHAAKQLVASGAIGRPALVMEEHALSGDHTVGAWVWNPDVSGGGALLYSGIHGLDRLRWLSGQEVEIAFAQVDRFAHRRGLEDNAAATLRLDGGCLAAVGQNFTPFAMPNYWETHLYGTGGVIRIATGSLEITDQAGRRRVDLPPRDHFAAQLQEFTTAIQTGRPPLITAEDGRANLRVVQALYESARTAQPVSLREPAAGRFGEHATRSRSRESPG